MTGGMILRASRPSQSALQFSWLLAYFCRETVFVLSADTVCPPAIRLSLRFGGGLALWFVAILGGTEAWYYDDWQASAERMGRDFTAAFRTRRSRCRCGRSTSVAIGSRLQRRREANGGQWLLHFIEWNPGPLRARVSCASSSTGSLLIGNWYEANRGSRSSVRGSSGIDLAFRAYHIRTEWPVDLCLFWPLAQNRSMRGRERGQLSESEHRAGLQAVLWRERNMGQQVAELACNGIRECRPSRRNVSSCDAEPVVVKATTDSYRTSSLTACR
jgi:hypothetical protein